MNYLTIPLILYASFILFLIFTLLRKRKKKPQTTEPLQPVSIIIPFRNEEKNLARLLESLNKQVYSGPIELILINDNSTDLSENIIKTYQGKIQYTIKCLDLLYESSRNLTSKQQALDLGIKCAMYEWIILTDADMTFNNLWVASLMAQTNSSRNTALVFGHTSINTQKTFFQYFQGFQLEFLFSAAYAFHISGIIGSCMGNNMAVSKTHYQQCGGFDKIGYSIVEDRALIAAFKKEKKSISFVDPFKPMAFTQPADSGTHFFQQIIRWALGGFSFQSNLIVPALLVLFQNGCLIAILALPFSIVTTFTILNFFLTWIFIIISFSKIQSPVNSLLFPFYYIFLQFETILIGWAMLFRPRIVWKGRDV